MSQLVIPDEMSPDQLQVLLNQILSKQQQAIVEQLKSIEIKQEKQDERVEILQHRIDNFDLVNVDGDPQQRLNSMIRKYAADRGIRFDGAWKEFRQSYDIAYHTSLTTLRNNYMERHGLKNVTVPQYLSMTGGLEDAIRVADKMLNRL